MTLFKMTTVAIALSLGLSACAGIQEWKAEQRAARASADRSKCIAMGFEVGTDVFRLCLDNRNIQRQVEYAQWEAENAARKAENAKRDAKREAELAKILGTD